MSEEKKERRCKACGKLLLDEKLPFCRRCVLEGRNKVTKVCVIVGRIAMTALSANALKHTSNGGGQA